MAWRYRLSLFFSAPTFAAMRFGYKKPGEPKDHLRRRRSAKAS